MTEEEQAAADLAAAEQAEADAKAKLAAPKVKKVAKPLDNQVFIGEPGNYTLVDLPFGVDGRERRININGKNYEHVDDDPTFGTWRFRAM